jgi:hypothetical protein
MSINPDLPSDADNKSADIQAITAMLAFPKAGWSDSHSLFDDELETLEIPPVRESVSFDEVKNGLNGVYKVIYGNPDSEGFYNVFFNLRDVHGENESSVNMSLRGRFYEDPTLSEGPVDSNRLSWELHMSPRIGSEEPVIKGDKICIKLRDNLWFVTNLAKNSDPE